MQKMEFILTLTLLVLGLLSCMLGSYFHLAWIGPVFVITFTLVYLFSSQLETHQIKLILCIFIIGYTIDSIQKLFGLIDFSTSSLMLGQLPLWFISQWLIFAVTFPILFAPIKRFWIAGLIGLFISSFYFLEMRLDLLQFHSNEYYSLISIGLVWIALLPAFLKLRMVLSHSQSAIKANNGSI